MSSKGHSIIHPPPRRETTGNTFTTLEGNSHLAAHNHNPNIFFVLLSVVLYFTPCYTKKRTWTHQEVLSLLAILWKWISSDQLKIYLSHLPINMITAFVPNWVKHWCWLMWKLHLWWLFCIPNSTFVMITRLQPGMLYMSNLKLSSQNFVWLLQLFILCSSKAFKSTEQPFWNQKDLRDKWVDDCGFKWLNMFSVVRKSLFRLRTLEINLAGLSEVMWKQAWQGPWHGVHLLVIF